MKLVNLVLNLKKNSRKITDFQTKKKKKFISILTKLFSLSIFNMIYYHSYLINTIIFFVFYLLINALYTKQKS